MKESIRALLDSIPEEKRQLKGREALAYLATLMKRIQGEDYKHESFYTTASGGQSRADFLGCGSAACAAGLGAVVFHGAPEPRDHFSISGSQANFYEITSPQSWSIFACEAYSGISPHPRTVEKRIRAVLKEYK